MSEPTVDTHLRQPLVGRKILVTRAADQAAALADPLARLGAEVIVCPTIAIVPTEDCSRLDQSLAELDRVDYLILSSANAVEFFFARLRQLGLDPASLRSKTIVAVGPKTAELIRSYGLKVDIIPSDYRAEGLVDRLRHQVAGRCVLYPKAGLARDLVPRQLTEAGAEVLDPVAYTSVAPADSAEILSAAVRSKLDLLTFTASSTVRNLVKLLTAEQFALARQVPVASIGPLTSQTARELGFHVVIEPEESTLPALIEAIRIHFERTGTGT
ncbi:MAG TPA: uroporphyrinogen-III synthase [Desulfuromonadales bacterium]|nr:uroporphyrinogen-III synthase [Desulfuromonadales bacterium]